MHHLLHEHYDVVVIGGGPIGLATAFECAKAKQKVLVLEKFVFFNQSGSSGDIVRMFRTAYTEDFMATLAYQCMPLWDDLEEHVHEKLRLMTGLLNFGDPTYGAGGPEGTLTGPIANLDKYHMQYTRLKKADIEEKHPFYDLPESWEGIDMPDNGVINVPLMLRKLYAACEELGVHLLQYADARRIVPGLHNKSDWRVEGLIGTDKGASIAPIKFSVDTAKIAITAGAYVNHVLEPSFGFTFNIDIWEMVYEYYAIDAEITFPKMWFQFANDTPNPGGLPISNLFYGFPSVPWGPPNIARIAVDTATQVIKDPYLRSHDSISPADLGNTRNWIRQHVRGVGTDTVPIFAGTCLQTNVFDNMFVLDYIPDEFVGASRSKSIAVFTAGWAMKFVPLIGKVLKQLLVDGGTTEYDIFHFKMDRKSDTGCIIKRNPTEVEAARVTHHSGSAMMR